MKKDLIITMFDVAITFGNLSKSKRLKVGAVLEREGRIIATGYNGLPSGYEPDVLEEEGDNGKTITKDEVIHAELNAIINCAREGVSTKGSTLYITHSPCKHCTSLIKQSGITKVLYLKDYRDTSGIDSLRSLGIEVIKFDYLNSFD